MKYFDKTKKIITLVAIIILIMQIPIVKAQIPSNDPAFYLAFVDSFNGTQVDSSWKSGYDWNQSGHYPDSTSICQAIIDQGIAYRKGNFENCIVDSGILTIVSKKENYSGLIYDWIHCPSDSCSGSCFWSLDKNDSLCWYQGYMPFEYTTNMLISKQKFKYGYFEIRCKLPKPTYPYTNKGVGPNFWLYGVDNVSSWSEIDIFEFHGDSSICNANEFLEDIYGDTIYGVPGRPSDIYIDFSTYHTFAALWTPDKIEFYYDNVLFTTFTYHVDRLAAMPMIIDVNFPISGLYETIDTVNTLLPRYYKVDYVKVWQLKMDSVTSCNEDKVYCNFNPSTYNDSLYKSVTIGGSGCNASITNQSNFSIYGNDFVELNEGFSVDNQTNIYINAQNNCPEQQSKNLSVPNPVGPPPDSYYKRMKYH